MQPFTKAIKASVQLLFSFSKTSWRLQTTSGQAIEVIVFLHCSYFCYCTENPNSQQFRRPSLKNSFSSHYLPGFQLSCCVKSQIPDEILKVLSLQCFDFSFIQSRRVCSRVDSFDRRVTSEQRKSLVFSGLFNETLQAFLIKQLFHSRLLDMR